MLTLREVVRLKDEGENIMGMEIPTLCEGVLFWYYPDTGEWTERTEFKELCDKHKEDIERMVKGIGLED